jgi:hypothetical protein
MSRIFIVDDEPNIVHMLSEFLADEGYAVAGGTNSLKAVEQAKQFGPDLILLNTCMPYRDGFEVALLLGEDQILRGVPIVLTTSCTVLRGGPSTIWRCWASFNAWGSRLSSSTSWRCSSTGWASSRQHATRWPSQAPRGTRGSRADGPSWARPPGAGHTRWPAQ